MLHHLDTTKKPVIGKQVQSIERHDDHTAIISFQDGTRLEIGVEGDCCSRSIFYAIEYPVDIPGGSVTDIIEGSEGTDGAHTEEEALKEAAEMFPDFVDCTECIRVWNVVIKTTKGDIVLRHMNDSNGYYDGCTYFNWLRKS